MPLIIPPDYGQVTHHFALASWPKSMSWSHGYLFTGIGDASAHANSLAIAASASGAPYHADNMVTAYTYLGTTVIENSAGTIFVGAAPQTTPGTHIGSASPPNVSILVKKGTGLGGRKNQGRAFVPPLHFDEGEIDQTGTIESSNLSGITTAYGVYYTSIVADDLTPVILHSAVGTPAVINAFLPQGRVATQRRRLR